MKSALALALLAVVSAQTTATKTTTTATTAPATTTTATTAATNAAVTAATTAANAAIAAATGAGATALNSVSVSDAYYKNRFVDWSAFTTDVAGNTAGWQMYGNFGTREVYKGAEPDFIMNMTVSPPTTFVAAANQVWQMYSTFTGWDTASTATAVSDVNLLLEFSLSGDAKAGWSANEDYSDQFCSVNSKSLATIKSGGSSAVKLTSTGDCVDAWDSYPTCSYELNTAGRNEATCEISRDFTYAGAKQLSVGMPYTFQVGFNVWKDSATGSTLKPLAAGTSVAMTWTLIEGASSLALTAAAAVLVTLSF